MRSEDAVSNHEQRLDQAEFHDLGLFMGLGRGSGLDYSS
jgi:hypothetical protein